MNKTKQIAVVAGTFLALNLFADVWYVNDDNYGRSGNGKTETTAFGTIQEAIDAAQPDDTVFVAEGVYDKGSTKDGFSFPMQNRVYIDKSLTLCGANREKTIIKGGKASGDPSLGDIPRQLGLGSDAVRCIGINASNVVISNFTITGGATKVPSANDNTDGNGGAIYAANGKTSIVIADSIVSNNVAHRAGAARYGNDNTHNMAFVRTWFHRNLAANRDPVTRGCLLAHCLVTTHPCQSDLIYSGTLVNCTFADNRMRAAAGTKTKAYNCLFADSFYKIDYAGAYYENCALPTDSSMVSDLASTVSCVFNAGYDHFVAPVLKDWRLHENASNAIGKGSATHLALVPEEYRNVDFCGDAFDSSKGVNIGCCQTPVKTKGGTIRFQGMPGGEATGTYGFSHSPADKYFFGDGGYVLNFANYLAYMRAVSPRTVLKVRSETTTCETLFGIAASGSDGMMRFPLMDGSYDFLAPPEGETLTLTPVAAGNILYVDKSSAKDREDGSKDYPFKKIQSAVEESNTRGGKNVILVSEGVYDNEDGLNAANHNNSVVLKGTVRLVSADGAGKAVIAGRADTSVAQDAWPFGCGANARRPVYVNGTSAVQGFVLKDGRCADPSVSSAGRCGGGAYLEAGAQLLDCTISGNMAYQGGAVDGGDSGRVPVAVAIRCVIAGNFAVDTGANDNPAEKQKGIGICRRTTLASCVFSKNHGMGFGAWESQYAYHCTFIGPGFNANTPTFLTSTVTNVNSIVVSPKDNLNRPVMLGGTLVDGNGAISPNSEDVVSQDALVANPDSGDYRISALSPARDAAYKGAFAGTANSYHTRYYVFGANDLYGNRFDSQPSGVPVCGAVALFAPTVMAKEGVTLSDPSVSGDGIYTVLCTASKAAIRPYKGMVVNGATQEVVSATYEFSVPNEGSHPDPYPVEAIYDTDWFVDPAGSDSGWGTAASPKKTLKGALSHAIAGDTVYAASGTYDTETMANEKEIASAQEGDFALATRAVVPDGVSLVGAGAESTFIVGKSDLSGDEIANGCGDAAVRCVSLGAGSSLSGFTVTGGRTKVSTLDNKGDDLCGGGILASRCANASSDTLYGKLARISDCVISNCVAVRGGGAYNGIYNRCRFFDNAIVKGGNGAACRGVSGQYLYCYNTIMDRNSGYSTTYFAHIENCTIGADNMQDGNRDSVSVFNNSLLVANTLILGNKSATGNNGNIFSNCVFNAKTEGYLLKTDGVTIADDCIVAEDDSMLAVDDEYAPVIGANLAIDAANGAISSAALGDSDVYGNPRKVNGLRLDAGAVEADWKAVYSQALGRRVNVIEASGDVLWEKETQGVILPAGATLEATFGREGSAGERIEVKASVASSGTLVVEALGESRILGEGSSQKLAVKSVADNTRFAFASTGASSVLESIASAVSFCIFVR